MRAPRPFVILSDDEPQAPGSGLLAFVLAALVGLVLWVGIIAGARWFLTLPEATQVQLLAGALLVLGSVAVFEGLARSERRRGSRDRHRVSEGTRRRLQ